MVKVVNHFHAFVILPAELPHMIVHYGYENLEINDPVVTLGIFDGVHIGHKALIERLVSRAQGIGGESVIITFDPHPRSVLSENNSHLFFLTTLEEKKTVLEEMGVDHLIIVPFDHDLSNKEACQFIEEVLIRKIGTKYLMAGFNNRFGKKGDGDFSVIRKCAESFGIVVEQVEGLKSDLGIVSSSLVREELLAGNLDNANFLLGYSYFLSGTVSPGKMIGREIGFPTANIVPESEHKLVPGDGVYAVKVFIDGYVYNGMLSIGTNPTFNSDTRTIEVNIFDFEKEIYNHKIKVIFVKRLRDMKKFNGISDLKAQLEEDKSTALLFLST
jgi:riboflavin kinase / FMN adenylyltransferase